jgi:hypothetical protein
MDMALWIHINNKIYPYRLHLFSNFLLKIILPSLGDLDHVNFRNQFGYGEIRTKMNE